MRRIVRVLAVVFSLPVSLGAIGLAGGDSYPGLRAMRPPLRITWTVDAVTVGQLGGAPGFAADLGATAFKRLKAAGVPVKDGSFDPRSAPFVSLDLWVRGATRPQESSDPQRVFNFQLQVFGPAAGLQGASKQRGRITVWERSVYGSCAAADVKDPVRTFLRLCDDFASDWRLAHAKAATNASGH